MKDLGPERVTRGVTNRADDDDKPIEKKGNEGFRPHFTAFAMTYVQS